MRICRISGVIICPRRDNYKFYCLLDGEQIIIKHILHISKFIKSVELEWKQSMDGNRTIARSLEAGL